MYTVGYRDVDKGQVLSRSTGRSHLARLLSKARQRSRTLLTRHCTIYRHPLQDKVNAKKTTGNPELVSKELGYCILVLISFYTFLILLCLLYRNYTYCSSMINLNARHSHPANQTHYHRFGESILSSPHYETARNLVSTIRPFTTIKGISCMLW